jgi:hypothetical protein
MVGNVQCLCIFTKKQNWRLIVNIYWSKQQCKMLFKTETQYWILLWISIFSIWVQLVLRKTQEKTSNFSKLLLPRGSKYTHIIVIMYSTFIPFSRQKTRAGNENFRVLLYDGSFLWHNLIWINKLNCQYDTKQRILITKIWQNNNKWSFKTTPIYEYIFQRTALSIRLCVPTFIFQIFSPEIHLRNN